MSPALHKELLEMVRPRITRQTTNFREPISAEERLSLTIRYLTTGDSVTTLHQSYLVGRSSVYPIIRDTCKAIYSVLQPTYLQTPNTEAAWLAIAERYESRWNLPNVLGSVDGKHIRIRRPASSGSLYYNYKGYYSIVLLAVVDADYKFVYVDVGAEGRASDSRLWRDSKFYQDCCDPTNPLGIPKMRHIEGMEGDLPYYFVGDDAFALSYNLMKPFPNRHLSILQRIYNYRTSRVRRSAENGFGILGTRCRVFRREIDMEPDGVTDVVLAAVALHNFLRTKAPNDYIPPTAVDREDQGHQVVPGQWRTEEPLDALVAAPAQNSSTYVKHMRERLAAWCMSKHGEVAWQYKLALGED